MKKIIMLLTLLLSFNTFSQIHKPVKWTTSVVAVSDNKYDLIMQATIEDGWHLYSQNVPQDGPVPTAFNLNKTAEFELIGKTSEEKGRTIDDPIFKMKIKFFEGKAIFKQRINVLSNKPFKISGEVEFMVCDDANCLPPSYVDLNFDIPASKIAEAAKPKEIDKVEIEKQIVSSVPEVAIAKADTIQEIPIDTLSGEEVLALVSQTNTDTKVDKSTDRSLWAIFIIAFFSGFAALLTPCVFPMIPMTVSFFTKQSKTRVKGIKNAIIYGFSIVIIYVLLGSLVSAVFGADALNALSTNVWFNIIFFVLLIEKYIASLPTNKKKEKYQNKTQSWLKDTNNKEVFLTMEDPKATVRIAFKKEFKYSLKNSYLIKAFQDVLELKLMETLREQEGGTYGASVYSNLTKRPAEVATFYVYFDCDPDRVEKLVSIVHQEIEKIINNGIAQTDLDKVKTSYLKEVKEEKEYTSYQLNVLYDYYIEGYNKNDAKNNVDLINGIQPQEVQNFAQSMMKEAQSFEIIFKPKK